MSRVLITGGGSGVGAALALGFAEAGHVVLICGRRPAPLAEVAARHGAIRPLLAYVTDEASTEALFAAAGRCEIVIASTTGLKGYAKAAPYAAAKHGTMGLVKSLAPEVARRPITCDALCPGFLDTEMTAQSIRTIVEKTGQSPEVTRAIPAGLSPQNRLCQPQEIVAAALWLCGPGAEGVNGQGIAISGGEP